MEAVLRSLFMIICVAIMQPVRAAGDRDLLRGLNYFYLAVEQLDEDAQRCGVQIQDIETSVRYILQQSGIKVTTTISPLGYIYANLTMLENCAFAYQLELKVPIRVVGNGTTGVATIWDSGGVSNGPRSTALSRVTRNFENMAKRLVSDWSAVNQ